MTQKWNKILDIGILLLSPVLALAISFAFKLTFIPMTLVFFVPVSLYFTLRTPKSLKKILLFALIGMVGGFVIDLFAQASQSWYINSVIDFKFFNLVTIDGLIWSFTHIYFVCIVYEHFFDHSEKEKIDRRNKWIALAALLCVIAVSIIAIYLPAMLNIPYFYLFMGIIVLLIPSILILSKYPKLRIQIFKVGCAFFVITLLQEIAGLGLNNWAFLGNSFVGWVSIFSFRFPLEELFFWMMVFSISLLSFYEFFMDDRK